MNTVILRNGLKVLFLRRSSNTVSIEVNVKTGSNMESDKNRGISHFIEHLLFEGTKKRPDPFQISNEIEKLGGELNAATSNERTFYYIKVLNRHFDLALDVLSDIIKNPLFRQESIDKEKKVVIDEIKLVNDQPRYLQWIMFQDALYRKHPSRHPVYGSIQSIKKISRRDILDYYRRHYAPNNMTISVVGNAGDVLGKIKDSFSGMKRRRLERRKAVKEPKQGAPLIKRIKKSTLQAYLILGYRTALRKHKDSYALDVARAILGRGQSGKIFNEVRTRRGLAYDVGVLHNPSTDFGYFAVYVNTNRKNIDQVRKIILDELKNLKKISEEELREAKTFLEGELLMQTEDTQKMTDLLASWEQADSWKSALDYVSSVNKVTKKDIERVAHKYFDRNYTMTVIE